MIDVTQSNVSALRMTTRLIAQEALTRGWKVQAYKLPSVFMTLHRPDGKKIETYSSTPPTTSFYAARMADDKYLTSCKFIEAGFPAIKTYLLSAGSNDNREVIKQALKEDGACVVKPLDVAHGNGVSVDIRNEEDAMAALEHASAFSATSIIQKYYQSMVDVRLTCVNNKLASAFVRLPARVKGDGVSSISDLIKKENQNSTRGTDYEKELNFIDEDMARDFLKDKIHSVPPEGEWVNVVGVANLGAGGELVDVIDEIPQWFADIAIEAARLFELPVCAVDFLTKEEPHRHTSPEDLQPVIIEINKCPSLVNSAASQYLDYLETI